MLKKPPQKKEYLFIHYLRILGALAVVTIHSVGLNSDIYQNNATPEWWVSITLHSYSIWAVPVFVMISGALLLGRNDSGINFYKRRLIRIGVPTVFWILFYLIYFHWLRNDPIDPISIISRFIVGPIDHLYFLFIVLGLYAITPLLRHLVTNIDKKNFLLFILLLFYIGIFWKQSRLTLTYFIPMISYYLWGFYLMNNNLNKRIQKYLPHVFLIVPLVLTGLTYVFSIVIPVHATVETWYLRHFNPLVILLATSVFVILQNSNRAVALSKKIHTGIIRDISSATLGIYVIHWFVLNMTILIFNQHPLIQSMPWYLMLAFIPYTFLVSYIVTKIIMKIPLLKYTV